MPTSVAIGFSQAEDPKEAAHQASIMVKNELNSVTMDMAILIVSIHYAQKEIVDIIQTILKPTRLVGTSSLGVMLSHGVFNRGLALVGINSTDIHFGVGSHTLKQKEDFRQFGFELSRQMLSDYKATEPKRASIIFYDSLVPYRSSFLLGAQDALGRTSKIITAFSCDDFKLKTSYQFIQKQIQSQTVTGFIIGSDNPVIVSNKHGFKPLGKPRTITSVKGNIIQTIDNKPAIKIYEEYLKTEAQNIKSNFLNSPAIFYPLGLYLENLRQYLLRYPIDILDDGSIVCQAEVPPQTEVHLMITNKDSCKIAATIAAKEVKDMLGARQAQLLILINSMTKHKILGRNSYLEVQAIKEVFGHTVPLVGLYSFGEICPLNLYDSKLESPLENASLSLIAIS